MRKSKVKNVSIINRKSQQLHNGHLLYIEIAVTIPIRVYCCSDSKEVGLNQYNLVSSLYVNIPTYLKNGGKKLYHKLDQKVVLQ